MDYSSDDEAAGMEQRVGYQDAIEAEQRSRMIASLQQVEAACMGPHPDSYCA